MMGYSSVRLAVLKGTVSRLTAACPGISGRSEGDKELEGLLDSIRNLMESMGWGITEAMNALRIPEDERQVYINKLSQSGL